MQINEEITVKFSPDDLKKIVQKHLEENGYMAESIYFDIKERCEGFLQGEHYVKYLDGAVCKVKRNS